MNQHVKRRRFWKDFEPIPRRYLWLIPVLLIGIAMCMNMLDIDARLPHPLAAASIFVDCFMSLLLAAAVVVIILSPKKPEDQ